MENKNPTNLRYDAPKQNKAQELYDRKTTESKSSIFSFHEALKSLGDATTKTVEKSIDKIILSIKGKDSTHGDTLADVNKNISIGNSILGKIYKIQRDQFKIDLESERRARLDRMKDSSRFSVGRMFGKGATQNKEDKSNGFSLGGLGALLGPLLAALGLGGLGALFGSGDLTDRLKQVSSVVRGVTNTFKFLASHMDDVFKLIDKLPIAGKVGAKIGAKIGIKGGAALLKKIPGIGAIAGLLFGIKRFSDGDTVGGIAEIGSGIASLFGPPGMMISAALDALLIVRDIKTEGATSEDESANRKKFDKKAMYAIPGLGTVLRINEGMKLWSTDKSEALKQFALAGLSTTPIGPALQIATEFFGEKSKQKELLSSGGYAASAAEAAKIEKKNYIKSSSSKMAGWTEKDYASFNAQIAKYDETIAAGKSATSSIDADEFAKEYIKKKEGLKLTPYKLGDGAWTVGYGHVLGPDTMPQPNSISQEQADEYFNSDYKKFRSILDKKITAKLTPSQTASLVSLAYNTGHIPDSIANAINNGDIESAASILKTYRATINGGQPFAPLEARRAEEAQMLFAKNGMILNGSRPVVAGEAGPEAIIPLNRDGISFMADAMNRAITTGAGTVQSSNTIFDNMKTYLSGEFIDKFVAKLVATNERSGNSGGDVAFAMF